jgi:hypothetical protein
MRSRIALTLGIVSTLGLAGCDLEPPQEVTLRIDHYREPCPDGQAGYCLRLLEADGAPVSYAREIAGLEHAWGTEYEVRALVAPSDGTLPCFDLVEVVAEHPIDADARFQLALPPAFVERVDGTSFDLLGQARARCATPEVCNEVVNALYEEASVDLELSYDDPRAGTFVAHAAAVRRD